ncbi:putative [histone H3]-lysine(4) N-trimethyltransferase [Helianthus annuus]|nr:putative [histone H3]-lysine(4) N-trimethyltransferase [Helianthus annuus]
MATQTLSETEFYQWMNESLAKLESQLQTLLNEFRSLRTTWEARSPTSPPTSATTSSQPTLKIAPSPEPAPEWAPPLPTLTQQQPPQVLASPPLVTSPTLHIYLGESKNHGWGLFACWRILKEEIVLLYHVSSFAELRKTIYKCEGKNCYLFKGEVGRREWHPPWRPIETASNATNRIEWRPP